MRVIFSHYEIKSTSDNLELNEDASSLSQVQIQEKKGLFLWSWKYTPYLT